MSTQANSSTATFPFAAILTLIFITLKLTGNIDWSWWWVLSPLWITVALAVGTLLIVGAVFGLAALLGGRK